MGIIKSVGVKRLIRNGKLGNRVIDHGAFFSLAEARTSVSDGSIELVTGEGNVNVIMVMDRVEKNILWYEWSFSLNDFTAIGHGDSNPPGLANAFIRLTGSDEFIGFSSCTGTRAENLLKWSNGNDWTLYMKIPELLNAQSGQYVNIVSHGGNNILARMGGTNHGIYVNGETSYQAGMNTWYPITANSVIIFKKIDGYMEYWLNGFKRGNLNISSYTDATNGIIKFGTGSADFLKGGVDNIIMWDKAISSNDINEINSGAEVESTVVYGDAIVHLKCGEDVYPTVVDHKGTLTGGELFNGRPEDFVEIITP